MSMEIPNPVSSACQGCGACLVPRQDGDIVSDIVERVLRRVSDETPPPRNLPSVGVSVRHVHLTGEVLSILYGPGYHLNKLRDLIQPGEFAAKETVVLVGPKMRTMPDVRILGPTREYTQVELAHTDGIVLGLDLPVRRSGDLEGTEPIVLVGPKASVSLKEGAIRATRHIHMSPQDSEEWGLSDGDIVRVRVPGARALVFDNVLIRVDPNFVLEMHLDTDDANAADIRCGTMVEIID